MKQLLAATLSFLLVLPAVSVEAAAQQPAPAAAPAAAAPAQAASAEQPAPLSADQLQGLVAPIALYPDALVAQVLGAATFPDQVVAANEWLTQNKSLTGENLMKAVDKQPWDPSVKALTEFASVLDNMAKNLTWTSSLGEAYHNQAADVMAAVQTLRAKAKAAGNLQTGSQITVVQQSPQVIVIQPTNPQVIYVPTYNPTVVYGAPVATPGYSTAAVVTTAVVAFGIGIAVGAAMNNNYYWGYSSWNCNWHSSTVVYRSTSYYGNSAWHGGVYGSSVTAYGPNGAARAGTAYNSNTGTYARGAQTVTPYGKQSVAPGLQPEYRSLWRHPPGLQRLRPIRQFGRLKGRQHRIHPAPNHRKRNRGHGTGIAGWQCCGGLRQIRQQWCCRTNRKRRQICRPQRQRLQQHWQWLEPDAGHAPQHLQLLRNQLGEFRCRSRLRQ